MAPAFAQSPLIADAAARRAGLTRSWFTQVSVARSSDQISHMVLSDDTLFVQTSGAMLHAINAETGQTLWAHEVGQPDRLSLATGANAHYVATVNGSTLYLLDRSTGVVEWSRRMRGACGAGPVLTKTHVFVPMVSGMLEGYVLSDKGAQTPWIYQSFGRIFNQPVITVQSVSWTTDKGNLYVAKSDPMLIGGRLQTRSPIESRPAYWTPYFFACSLDGYVYAVHEKSAQTVWRFSAGEPISEPPVAVDGQLYIVPQLAGMFCLDAATGKDRWLAPGITQFVAKSKNRIYAIDKTSRLVALDAATGSLMASLPIDPTLKKLHNDRTDRIFCYGPSGLVECLHEIGLSKPLVHEPPPSSAYDDLAAKIKAIPKKAAEGDEDPAAEPAKGDDMKADDMKAGDDKAGDAMDADKPKPPAEPDPFK